MTDIDWPALRRAATEAAQSAYAPYSRLGVGAAAVVDDGRVISGCNVENSSFGLTLCAECGLVSALHRSGGGRLVALAVVDRDGNPLTPCGRCRQILHEAGGPELVVNEDTTAGELLPGAFGPHQLPE